MGEQVKQQDLEGLLRQQRLAGGLGPRGSGGTGLGLVALAVWWRVTVERRLVDFLVATADSILWSACEGPRLSLGRADCCRGCNSVTNPAIHCFVTCVPFTFSHAFVRTVLCFCRSTWAVAPGNPGRSLLARRGAAAGRPRARPVVQQAAAGAVAAAAGRRAATAAAPGTANVRVSGRVRRGVDEGWQQCERGGW